MNYCSERVYLQYYCDAGYDRQKDCIYFSPSDNNKDVCKYLRFGEYFLCSNKGAQKDRDKVLKIEL